MSVHRFTVNKKYFIKARGHDRAYSVDSDTCLEWDEKQALDSKPIAIISHKDGSGKTYSVPIDCNQYGITLDQLLRLFEINK